MTFESLGLNAHLSAKLAEQNITEPTPIQAQAIPSALKNRDVLGLAQTGTGKTAAFGLPLIQIMSGLGIAPAPKAAGSLILAPTRELAGQILDNLRAYSRGSHLRITLVVGGASINKQVQTLARGTDILIATPGRLIDLLDRRAVRLDETRFLVLDEADQMLDMGFIHALRRIAPLLPSERQTMLFSATMAKQLEALARTYLNDPVRVEITPPGRPVEKIAQSLHFVTQSEKGRLLISHLARHPGDLALVFARTKHGAERLMKALDKAGFAAGSIHGNKSQGQRDRALAAFRKGSLKVLVATDVAARGLDIPDVRHVYNFDLPNVPANYVHRIGRTARAGRDGAAIAYCAPGEMGQLRDIEKTLGQAIPVAGGQSWQPEAPAKPVRKQGGKPSGKSSPKRRRRPRRATARMAA